MRRPIACAGPLMTVVYAVCANGVSPGWDFYSGELDDTDFFEFKSFQVRMPCYFQPGRTLVITHGFRKKGGRIPPSEIARAKRIRKEDSVYSADLGARNKWRN